MLGNVKSASKKIVECENDSPTGLQEVLPLVLLLVFEGYLVLEVLDDLVVLLPRHLVLARLEEYGALLLEEPRVQKLCQDIILPISNGRFQMQL